MTEHRIQLLQELEEEGRGEEETERKKERRGESDSLMRASVKMRGRVN